MCRSRTDSVCRAGIALAAVVLTGALCGCSEMYFDHREGVSLGAGDAVAANEAMQTIDPWPARSANPNIAANGQRMQSAVERYRTNIVTQPVDPMQIQTANQTPPTLQVTVPPSAPPPTIGSGSTSTTTTVVTAPPAQASQ